MTDELKMLFKGLSFDQKRQFLTAVRALLESTSEKLAQDYDNNMTSEQKLAAVSETIGLKQLIYSYSDGLRDLEKNPQAQLDTLWTAVEKYVGSTESKN